MLIYRNFIKSTNPDVIAKYPDFASVIEDESGNDWYEIQSLFKEDTLKIIFDNQNRIVSHSCDVSTLFPLGNSIAEISKDALPANFYDNNIFFDFVEGQVIPHEKSLEKRVEEAFNQLKALQSEASQAIDTLQDAIDLNMAEKGADELLKSWRKYRVLLSRVDTSTAPDIDWPVKPE
ncbi:tail fiber assembly protein [Providencia rettgeri]|uniref:tail fiber assembly protein n=1 Tax=Providencia TaxID=586 RepID=UPI001EE6D5D4|nr:MULTISPECIES: tail fiber assembly protein [Providencia]MCG5290658.1 tail fiber assembly protein [Providencia rettgeri]